MGKCGHLFCSDCCDYLFNYNEENRDRSFNDTCTCPFCWRVLVNNDIYIFEKDKKFKLDDKMKTTPSSKLDEIVKKIN